MARRRNEKFIVASWIDGEADLDSWPEMREARLDSWPEMREKRVKTSKQESRSTRMNEAALYSPHIRFDGNEVTAYVRP